VDWKIDIYLQFVVSAVPVENSGSDPDIGWDGLYRMCREIATGSLSCAILDGKLAKFPSQRNLEWNRVDFRGFCKKPGDGCWLQNAEGADRELDRQEFFQK
jgi:hypothetical protein